MNGNQNKSEVFKYLDDESSKRIILMDGPMGTMIQRYKLEENDYRGKILEKHSIDLKGNNDILNVTNNDIIKKRDI